jgi:hypothetical protein
MKKGRTGEGGGYFPKCHMIFSHNFEEKLFSFDHFLGHFLNKNLFAAQNITFYIKYLFIFFGKLCVKMSYVTRVKQRITRGKNVDYLFETN